MTKFEFLEALEYQLGNLNAGVKEDILDDFREHFADALRMGKSEEEVCETLGDPKAIAEEFMAEISVGGAVRSVPSPVTQASQNAVEAEPSEIKSVKLELRSGDIKIRGERGGKIDVNAKRGQKYVETETTFDGTYIIRDTRKFGISFFGGTDIALTIPEEYNGDLSVHTKSGDIWAEDLPGLNKLAFKTGMGDAGLRRVGCRETLEVSTGTGDVTAENCRGALVASSGAGDVNAEGHAGRIKISTGCGDVEVKSDTTSGSVFCHTGTGGIHIKCRRLEDAIDAATGTGDIKIRVNELAADISAKTGGGDIRGEFSEDCDAKFVLKTNFGDKRSAFWKLDDAKGVSRENARYTVQLRTNMGDVSLGVI